VSNLILLQPAMLNCSTLQLVLCFYCMHHVSFGEHFPYRLSAVQRATNPEVAYNVQLGLGMFPSIFGHQAPPGETTGSV